MFMRLMFYLCILSVVNWSNSVLLGSDGRDAAVWGEVLLKKMSFRTRVMRPPPMPVVLSYLSVV